MNAKPLRLVAIEADPTGAARGAWFDVAQRDALAKSIIDTPITLFELDQVKLDQVDADLPAGKPPLGGGRLTLPIIKRATYDKLATLGSRMIVDELAGMGTHMATPQPEMGVTYAAKISKAEALLDFNLHAQQLALNIRAFNPAPGAYFQTQGNLIKVWQAYVVDTEGAPGQLMHADSNGIIIACQQQALCITELQLAGSKRQTAAQFLAGSGIEFLRHITL